MKEARVVLTLASGRPDLIRFLDPNSTQDPHEILLGSHAPILLLCDSGHRWEVAPNNLRKIQPKNICPICTGRKLVPGVNDIATTHPQLARLFSPDSPLGPTETVAGGHSKVLVACETCGVVRAKKIQDLVYKDQRQCPNCKNGDLLVGVNDLATTHPDHAAIVSEDSQVRPNLVTSRARQIVKCKCPACGSRFEEKVHDLTDRLPRCTPCGRANRPVPGKDDFATTHPLIARYASLDSTMAPTQYSYKNNSVQLWHCRECGDEFTRRVRWMLKSDLCLDCLPSMSSKGERELAEWIASLDYFVVRNTRKIIKKELDIYIPDQCLAIEYNGEYWHSDKHLEKYGTTAVEYHSLKLSRTAAKGITLAFVWEKDWKSRRLQVERDVIEFLRTGELTPLLSKLEGL